MDSLSGLDAAFLYTETERAPMSVLVTVVLEGAVERDALASRIRERLPLLPPFRRRLREMPLALDHPVWIEDEHFDLDAHVDCIAAPAPGDERALEGVVARLARRALDRSRPLWQATLVEGLADGRTAIVIRAHHAALDGVSGAALLLHLFDRPGDPPRDAWRPEAAPDALELLAHQLGRLRARASAAPRIAAEAARSARRIASGLAAPGSPVRSAPLPFRTPGSPFNGPISGARRIGYARAPLAAVQRVRSVFGGTINDVVLAACASALQDELRDRGLEPAAPLVAAVPVSTRRGGDPAGGNRISTFLTELPVHLEDSLHQLAEVARATRRGKRFHATLGDRTLGALAELAPPGISRRALALYERLELAALHPPLVNLVVSNVPGPPQPLGLLGRRVDALRPHGPLLQGIGLNVTVMSYAGSIDVGVLACRARVPGAHRLADRITAAFEELAKLAESALPEIPPLGREVA